MKNRILAGVLAAALIICTLSSLQPIFAQTETITISSTEELIEFSKNCTLDSWSRGKTAELTCDISLEGSDFSPVPTFGGAFNGNGYTISGLRITKDGSNLGLFRYIQPEGKVTDLNVKGDILPGGSMEHIGGIAGENSGIIESCTFEGTIQGENVIGGIAGINTDSGKIIGCGSYGSITGTNSAGGITGRNEGAVFDCVNSAEVNTSYEDDKGSVTAPDTDAGALIENLKLSREENKENSPLGHSDTGGIAGYSSGIIQGCTNNADIGYQHVGYNVGGIAGRQSGYILGCQNRGLIRGRKDTGGITGQAEPYVVLDTSEDTLKAVRRELDNLRTMTDSFITDAEGLGDDTEARLTRLSELSEDAQGNAETMLDHISDFADGNIAEINAQAAILSDTIDKLIPVFESLESSGGKIGSAADDISDVLEDTDINAPELDEELDSVKDSAGGLADSLDAAAGILEDIELERPELGDELDDIRAAVNEMSRAESNIDRAARRAVRALNDLEDAVRFKDQTKVRAAVSELSESVSTMITSKQTIKQSLETIEGILRSKPESLESIGINAAAVCENIKTIAENTAAYISALNTAKESLDTLLVNAEINFSEFRSAAYNMQRAAEYMNSAMYNISNGLSALSDAIDSAHDAADEYLDDVSAIADDTKDSLSDARGDVSESIEGLENAADAMHDAAEEYIDETIAELDTAKDGLASALDEMSGAAADITDALGDMEQILKDLSDENTPEFKKLSDEFKTASDSLSGSVSEISAELGELKDIVSDRTNTLTDELKAIGDQLNVITDLIADGAEDLNDRNGDIVLDVSDEDIEKTKQGKIEGCYNSGAVEADRNTGGIAGAMAIEYADDPEDDIERPDTLEFTYRTKSILQSCINEGHITGKLDCTGGIVGYSTLGTVYICENYGNAESTDGDYTGGIAGKSEASVRRSYAKCEIGGKRYSGGIAGKGDIVSCCCSIVTIEGEENTGAICGGAENLNSLSQNLFVDNGLGAVDGISYGGIAEPAGFDAMKGIDGTPSRFISFTVRFVADDEVVEERYVEYGSSTSEIEYPKAPEKEGYYGKWQQPDTETVTGDIEIICEYSPYITSLESIERNGSGKLPLALAEGSFTDEAELHVTAGTEEPPEAAGADASVYDITISGTELRDGDRTKLRLLNENKNKAEVWLLKDGSWEHAEADERGRYIVTEITGDSCTACIKYTERGFELEWLILALFAVGGITCIFIILKKNHTKKASLKEDGTANEK